MTKERRSEDSEDRKKATSHQTLGDLHETKKGKLTDWFLKAAEQAMVRGKRVWGICCGFVTAHMLLVEVG